MPRKQKTKVSHEELIAALLSYKTIKQAAEALKVTERTIYEQMQDGEFQELYKAAKADLVRSAVFSINEKLQSAIDTTCSIMQDMTVNAAVRLQAAQTIISNAEKFSQRLQNDEDRIEGQRYKNSHKDWFGWEV